MGSPRTPLLRRLDTSPPRPRPFLPQRQGSIPLTSLCPCVRRTRAVALAAGNWPGRLSAPLHVTNTVVSRAPSVVLRRRRKAITSTCTAASPMPDPHPIIPFPYTEHWGEDGTTSCKGA